MTEHDDALPDLDLGVLGEGAGPSSGQWDAISSIAAHRRRRRSVVLSAAAVLILIAGTATVLVSRSDYGSTYLETGIGVSAHAYVIPPEGATDVNLQMFGSGYELSFGTGADQSWALRTYTDQGLADGGVDLSVTELVQALDAHGIQPQTTGPFDTVYLACSGELNSATWSSVDATALPDTTLQANSGALMATFAVGDRLVTMMSTSDRSSCSATGEPATELLEAVGELRVVDAAGFDRFRTGMDGGPPPTAVQEESVLEVPTTTTVTEDDPADVAGTEALIEAAVKGFDQPADDGTWPHLEDGVARADEYRQRQAAAEEQAGMTAVDDPDKVHEVVSITFESDEAALVQYDITVTLPGGRVTVPHRHRFILQDGVWKMSYDSYLQLSGLACTSPGGYGESCQTGSYDTFGKTGG
jgi:hypothetical protein